jgi:hypothetical protein
LYGFVDNETVTSIDDLGLAKMNPGRRAPYFKPPKPRPPDVEVPPSPKRDKMGKVMDFLEDFLKDIGKPPPMPPRERIVLDANMLCNQASGGAKCYCCVVFCQIIPQLDDFPDYSCSVWEAWEMKSKDDRCPKNAYFIPGDGSIFFPYITQ